MLLTLAAAVEVVVIAVFVTFDQEGAVIDVLVCRVMVAADLEVPVLKVPSKKAVIIPSQFAEVYCQYLGLVKAVSVVVVVAEALPISIWVSVLVMVVSFWIITIRADLMVAELTVRSVNTAATK